MVKSLNVILMHDDGRTWRFRVRPEWIKICLYGLLALLLASAAGIYGSFSLWRKMERISRENIVTQPQCALQQPAWLFPPPPDSFPGDRNQDFSGKTQPAQADFVADKTRMGLEGRVPDVPPAPASPLSGDPRTPLALPGQTPPVPDQEQRADQLTPTKAADPPSGKTPSTGFAEHLAEADNVRLALRDDTIELRFDLHNRSDTAIAGRISVSFLAGNERVVPATGDQRALRFRIRNFREVRSPLSLPTDAHIQDLHAMRLEILNPSGELLYAQTFPLAGLLRKAG